MPFYGAKCFFVIALVNRGFLLTSKAMCWWRGSGITPMRLMLLLFLGFRLLPLQIRHIAGVGFFNIEDFFLFDVIKNVNAQYSPYPVALIN
jgi:hypothetical protein